MLEIFFSETNKGENMWGFFFRIFFLNFLNLQHTQQQVFCKIDFPENDTQSAETSVPPLVSATCGNEQLAQTDYWGGAQIFPGKHSLR